MTQPTNKRILLVPVPYDPDDDFLNYHDRLVNKEMIRAMTLFGSVALSMLFIGWMIAGR